MPAPERTPRITVPGKLTRLSRRGPQLAIARATRRWPGGNGTRDHLFVRKNAKEYGTRRRAEGGEVSGQKLVIVEDVVSTGGAILDATVELRGLGAEIRGVVCVIDRETGGPANLAKVDLSLTAAFTMSQLLQSVGRTPSSP